jgi:flagellar biosynthesis regulator FlaF
MTMLDTPSAHRGAAAYRRQLTPKQMEAEVFARCARAARAAAAAIAGSGGDALNRARAVADNRRLWDAVHASVSDPANAMPQALRGGLAQLARAVLRECDAAEPDLDFMAEVNDQTAAGLWR